MGKKKIEESQDVTLNITDDNTTNGTTPPSTESVGQGVGDVPREDEIVEALQDSTTEQPQPFGDVASDSLPDASGVHSPSSVMGMDDELEATRQHYQAMNPTATCVVHRMGTGFSVSWVDQ